jgi:hypothetical protein
VVYHPIQEDPVTLISMIKTLRLENEQLVEQYEQLQETIKSRQNHPNGSNYSNSDLIEQAQNALQAANHQIKEMNGSLDLALQEKEYWRTMYEESAEKIISLLDEHEKPISYRSRNSAAVGSRASSASSLHSTSNKGRNDLRHPSPNGSMTSSKSTRIVNTKSKSIDRPTNRKLENSPSKQSRSYTPIRSAPLRSASKGGLTGSPKRFDPTEWARQRAEKLGIRYPSSDRAQKLCSPQKTPHSPQRRPIAKSPPNRASWRNIVNSPKRLAYTPPPLTKSPYVDRKRFDSMQPKVDTRGAANPARKSRADGLRKEIVLKERGRSPPSRQGPSQGLPAMFHSKKGNTPTPFSQNSKDIEARLDQLANSLRRAREELA